MTKTEKLSKKNVKRVTSVLLKLLESNHEFILPSVRRIQMELMNECVIKKALPYRRRMSINDVNEYAHHIYSNMRDVSAEHWERKRKEQK